MGDRVLFQVWSQGNRGLELSPVVYGHLSGSEAGNVCERLQTRMKGREGDVQYTAVRLVQELIGNDDGNLSFGMWNATKLLAEQDSHGDAGVVLIECAANGLRFQCLGGYLKASDDRTIVREGR